MGAVAGHPNLQGIGLDEDTALVVHADGTCRVVGSGAVYLVKHAPAGQPHDMQASGRGVHEVASLRDIVRSAKGASSLPVLATIPPCNENFNQFSPPQRNAWVSAVDVQIRDLARDHGRARLPGDPRPEGRPVAAGASTAGSSTAASMCAASIAATRYR